MSIDHKNYYLFDNLKLNKQKLILHSNYQTKISVSYFFKSFKYVINVFLLVLRSNDEHHGF